MQTKRRSLKKFPLNTLLWTRGTVLICACYLTLTIETTLSAKEQRVILLQYIYRHKLKEIAEILNEPEGTIHSISARAKKKLKARLEEGGYPYGR